MRQIEASEIRETIYRLILDASYNIGDDIYERVKMRAVDEVSEPGRAVLEQLIENYDIAKNERVAICQDTGMLVVFMDIGQDVHIAGGDLTETVNEAVKAAYEDGFLRKSVVKDPIYERVNTRDNTPAILHTRIVKGDKIDVTVIPKGFGSENMSAVKMLTPADGERGVIDFVVKTVENAGPNPCPPIIVGVGVGGTMEAAAIIAKRMTARRVDSENPNPNYARLEREILARVNALGIGPAGIGGRTTALKVNIDYCPTHIAGLPVAVNIVCHAARHGSATI